MYKGTRCNLLSSDLDSMMEEAALEFWKYTHRSFHPQDDLWPIKKRQHAG